MPPIAGCEGGGDFQDGNGTAHAVCRHSHDAKDWNKSMTIWTPPVVLPSNNPFLTLIAHSEMREEDKKRAAEAAL